MEQSPSSAARQFPASQEIPHILWTQKVHYRVYKRPAPLPVLSQISPVHVPHLTSWRSISIGYHSIYAWIFQVVSFPQFSTPKSCIHLSCSPYVLYTVYVPSFSFFSIWSPEYYLVKSNKCYQYQQQVAPCPHLCTRSYTTFLPGKTASDLQRAT